MRNRDKINKEKKKIPINKKINQFKRDYNTFND